MNICQDRRTEQNSAFRLMLKCAKNLQGAETQAVQVATPKSHYLCVNFIARFNASILKEETEREVRAQEARWWQHLTREKEPQHPPGSHIVGGGGSGWGSVPVTPLKSTA